MRNLAAKAKILLVVWLSMGCAAAQAGPYNFEFTELAPGVWAGIRPEGPRPPVMGSTVFVVGNESVVVFDGGGSAGMTDLLIEKIRSVTSLPVSDVVISHWHGDHHFGIHRIAQAFPGVRFIAHPFTRAMLDSTKVSYLDGQQNFKDTRLPIYQKMIDTGTSSDGRQLGSAELAVYQQLINDIDEIDRESRRGRVTPADTDFTDPMVLNPGGRRVELLFLGHGNTEGDLVMWLPEERIVAVGDIVVLPSPYAFNVPPKAWANTLRAIRALDYKFLVPGHGAIQDGTNYLDLLIEVAQDIAGQADALNATGVASQEIGSQLDFSGYEPRFTGGDETAKVAYHGYFEGPFRTAAGKALTEEPMVPIPRSERVGFTDERWAIRAEDFEVVEHLGKSALKLKGGAAILTDVSFKNAIIEFDLAVGDQRGFAGVLFRRKDSGNFENFYIRPHQSGNPDANQYQPVFNGVAAWQLYHGERYSTPVRYPVNEWIHVKIIYAGSVAKFFINSQDPILVVEDLKHLPSAGSIGISAANLAEAHFANFRYMPLANAYEFPYLGKSTNTASPGVITSWEISESFDRDSLSQIMDPNTKHYEQMRWTPMESEPDGTLNLARVQGISEGADTALVRTIIKSDTVRKQELTFGFSDAAVIYVNKQAVYRGDKTYRTRDYRYLGSLGLFDTVFVNLKPGDNEICFAVTENFGGWGLKASLTTSAPQ